MVVLLVLVVLGLGVGGFEILRFPLVPSVLAFLGPFVLAMVIYLLEYFSFLYWRRLEVSGGLALRNWR